MLFKKIELDRLPEAPGVYLMKDSKGKVLYVGKAIHLKDRVRQYFSLIDKRAMVPLLIAQVEEIETILSLTEREALLLENALIKQHKPKYNVLLKDDRSFYAFRIDTHVPYPRFELFRYRHFPKDKATYFGPYVQGMLARETFEVLHRVFPLRQCSDEEFARRKRPCILYGMHRCPAPCVGLCTEDEYKVGVREAMRFLKGNAKKVLEDLTKEMEACSEALEFEKAGEILKKIRVLERQREKRNTSLARAEDVDVISMKREGGSITFVQLVFRGGQLLGTEEFHFYSVAEEDFEALESFLMQVYQQKETPSTILLPFDMENEKVLEEILSSDKKVQLHVPKRGDLLALLKMASINAEAAFEREKEKSSFLSRAMNELKEALHFVSLPKTIECIDCSHLGGEEAVAAIVRFVDGVKDKKALRRYRIKTGVGGDDYASFREVLFRRFREKKDIPDLFVVDGGKAHLQIAMKILEDYGIDIEMIGIAKEEGRHDRGMSQEKIFHPQFKDPIFLKPTSSGLLFLQRLRDEAHASALSFQKVRRKKSLLKSALDDVPGIGPIKKKRLFRRFGSSLAIRKASVDELLSVEGITKKDIACLEAWKHTFQE